jgi:DnaJ-domain-containing protein 1
MLAFVVLDVGGLGHALVASVWVTPWIAINVAALVLGTLSWSEDRRIRRESATAMQRQGEELQRKAERQRQAQLTEAERRQRQRDEEREAQKRLDAALRKAQEQLREAEEHRYQQEKERETQREREEQAERVRQAEKHRREAEKRRQAEQEREAQRRRREHKPAAIQFRSDWWTVLGVAPSASKHEIVRKYRHKIKQCHPDRMIGVAPELLQQAEEQTKALNAAYENAMRARQYVARTDVAA